MKPRGAGVLDRRLQFRAAQAVDDGLAVSQVWGNIGPLYPCQVTQFQANETQAGGQVQAKQMTKFMVRRDSFTAAITPRNRIVYEGAEFEITAVQEPVGTRRAYLLMTAAARADLP
jgi:hypothetical protein